MNESAGPPEHVTVIGGGITGLAAAWYVRRFSPGTACTVLEASDRPGGKMMTHRLAAPGGGTYVVELGPDSLLRRKPWAAELAGEVGLASELVSTLPQPNGSAIAFGGSLHPVPAGVLSPRSDAWKSILRSSLFSVTGKLRILVEPLVRSRRETHDESLGAFVRRRFGGEMATRLAEPLLAGIYNADVDRLSVMAAFPNFRRLEQEHGSVARGMMRMATGRATVGDSPFVSLLGGMGDLPAAVAGKLDANLRTGCPVEAIEPRSGGWLVHPANGDSIHTSTIILATPAAAAAALVESVAPEAGDLLRRLRVTRSGTMSLSYRRQDVGHPLEGYGVVLARGVSETIDGVAWSSSKWPGRAPPGHVLIRVFFGGPRTASAYDLDDDDILARVHSELSRTLDIKADPLTHFIHRWQVGFPQYDVGHLDLVGAIRLSLPPGLHVCGSPYEGIGVPDCVRQARTLASNISDRTVATAIELKRMRA